MTDARWLPKADLQRLIDRLWAVGRTVLGPVEQDGCVGYDEVRQLADLPLARRDVQEPGRYRLVDGPTDEVFGVVHGPASPKRFLFAPSEPLVETRVDAAGLHFTAIEPEAPLLALLGVRSCDLAAIAIQDRIFLHDQVRDHAYTIRRARVALIVVQCTRSLSTCFCTSMGSGPTASAGFDLALTELAEGFTVESGSELGAELLLSLELDVAPVAIVERATAATTACADAMPRRLETNGLAEALLASSSHPRWNDVAERCLACGNCTMVCPTCFCHSVDDVTEIRAVQSQRIRHWASCFTPDHGQIHGMNFRPHIRDRYRMWLTHKLATWQQQFGTSGCVGCGRCATWCPVGIDLIDECNALRSPAATP